MASALRSRIGPGFGIRHGYGLLAGAVLVLVTAVTWAGAGPFDGGEPWGTAVVGWVLIVVTCGALALSRRWPVSVAGLTLVTSGVYYVTSSSDGPLLLAPVVALYTVAARGLLAAAVGLAALALCGTAAGTASGNDDVNGVALFMFAGWLVATVALGWARYSGRAYAREAERHAASEERLRIARELHDSIGHHLSLINVQSAAALRRFQKDPERGARGAGEAFGAVKDSSKEALRELRTTLGALRQGDEAAPTAPAPGLDRVAELLASARRAGLGVRDRTDPALGEVPAEVDRAAYRIVQEALTNVSRHADATVVCVEVRRGAAGWLEVAVVDDGRGAAGLGPVAGPYVPGSGIAGMRERARALGGELTAGPGERGGFAVRARLPLSVRGRKGRKEGQAS